MIQFSVSSVSICTIISKNYLPFARVLAESFYEHNEGTVYVLLVDAADGYFTVADERFTVVEIEQLRDLIPDFERFCFQYTILELNTAVKPYFLEYLFRTYGLAKLIYFDPDIQITNSLDTLYSLLDRHSAILTPHLTAPISDSYKPSEVDILMSGTYNLGFLALSQSATTFSMLSWWQERLYSNCIHAVEKGLFVDQKWMDLVPGMYEGTYILNDPGYNVAYWNLHSRAVKMVDDTMLVHEKPVYFFHFSGFDPENMEQVSKHQNRYTMSMLKDAQIVFRNYRDRLFMNGYRECKNWPYVYGYFDNGEKIPDITRRLYLSMKDHVKKFGNPFSTAGNSYFAWLNEKLDREKPPITRILHEIYTSRHDVQKVFPDIFGTHREGFLSWVLTSAKKEYQLGDLFLEDIVLDAAGNRKLAGRILFLKILNACKQLLKTILKKLFWRSPRTIERLKLLNRKLNLFFSVPTNTDIRTATNTSRKITEPGVNIAGYITSESGTGEGVRSDIRIIRTIDIPYVLNNLPSTSRQNDDNFTSFRYDNPYAVNLIHVNADQVPVFLSQKGADYFRDRYNIGYWVWELSAFPKEWFSHFHFFNEIWTASAFCLESIATVSPIPVVKIPHCVSIDKIKNADRSHFGLSRHSFIFFFMFDFLSYFERKNPLALIEAFKRAFPNNSDVTLVLKCSNSRWNPSRVTELIRCSEGLDVRIIDRYLDKDELYALLSLSNCYVSLHRSEGFGLTIAEAMYLGKPVIATAYSGNMDFMTPGNSFPVKYRLTEIETDLGPYKKGDVWAEPDIDHAAELMRFVYHNRDTAQQTGQVASIEIKTRYSPSAIGKRMKERLGYIMQIR